MIGASYRCPHWLSIDGNGEDDDYDEDDGRDDDDDDDDDNDDDGDDDEEGMTLIIIRYQTMFTFGFRVRVFAGLFTCLFIHRTIHLSVIRNYPSAIYRS